MSDLDQAISELMLSILSGAVGVVIGATIMILILRYIDGWWIFQWIQRIENKIREINK
jgi:hypothetical protein